LARVLHENGFATQSYSMRRGDGFKLINTYITAAIRCAPPQNKPKKEELENCFGFIDQEFKVLKNIKVIICLGKIAFDTCCSQLQIETPRFSHGRVFYNKNRFIISSYHPSRQKCKLVDYDGMTGICVRQGKNIFRK